MRFVIVLLLSCISISIWSQHAAVMQKHQSTSIHEIDLYTAFKNIKTYPLSTVAESIKYIPLERTKDCIIGPDIGNIFVSSKDIIVFDFEQCYRFGKNGKFLNRIGKPGRGPEELIRPMDVEVDSINQWVYILDHDRLVKYDFNGKHIKTIPLGFDSMNMLLLESQKIVLDDMFYQYAKPKKRFSVKIYSEKDERVISMMACEKKDDIPFSICHPSMYQYNNQTYVKGFWDDMIYQVQNPNNLQAYASIEKGKFKHRDRDDKSPITGKVDPKDKMIIDVSFMAESDRFIFLTTSKGLFFYDKIERESFCSTFIKSPDHWYSFINDLNGGPHTKSNSFPKHAVKNNVMVTYHNAYEFFDTEGSEGPEIKKLKSNLSPDDNPVLALITIKS